MKVPFNTIFESKKRKLYFKEKTRVAGITCDAGTWIKGICFNGINFYNFKNRDLDIEIDKDTFVITGIY